MGHEGEHGDPTRDLQLVEVEERLESRLVDVESAVVTYLVRITAESQSALVAALHALDADTSASDAFRSRLNAMTTLTGMPGLGASSTGVIGQRSTFPIVNEVPRQVFQAQIGLVRAAKEEIRKASPATLNALDAANTSLASMRSRYVR